MRNEINPAIAVVVVVALVLIVVGIWVYSGVASTRTGKDLAHGMNVQAAGVPMPQQKFVPKAN
jgi:hypothetical protein